MNSESASFEVIFRGVRGSYPVPGPSTLRGGGNTTCHEVRVGGHRLLLDAGTGIIEVGREMVTEHLATKEPMRATLLFSHVHHDHTYGFLYFKPAYFKSTQLSIHGPKTYVGGIEDTLRTLLCDPFHPVQLDEMGMHYHTSDLHGSERLCLRPGEVRPVELKESEDPGPDDVLISVRSNWRHTKLGVLHFRIEYHGKSYVFATDTEGCPEGDPTLLEFAAGADLLAHDTQYTDEEYTGGHPPRKGWGHSTVSMSCKLAEKAEVKRLALIHHDPERDDDSLDEMERAAQTLFPAAFLAREGMCVTL